MSDYANSDWLKRQIEQAQASLRSLPKWARDLLDQPLPKHEDLQFPERES